VTPTLVEYTPACFIKTTAFWVSFLLSPIIGLLLVIASNPLTPEQIEENKQPQTIVEEPKEDSRDVPSVELNELSKQKITTLYIVLVAVAFIFIFSSLFR